MPVLPAACAINTARADDVVLCVPAKHRCLCHASGLPLYTEPRVYTSRRELASPEIFVCAVQRDNNQQTELLIKYWHM